MKNTDTQKKVELKEYDLWVTFNCKGLATILAEDEEHAYKLAWKLRYEDPDIDIVHNPVVDVEAFE